MDETVFANLFATFDRMGAPDKYSALRQAARSHFQSQPFPTPRTEDWRFTNLSPLLETKFAPPESRSGIDRTLLPARATPASIELVFVNGTFDTTHSSAPPFHGQMQIGSLADVKADGLPLARLARENDSPFTALNTGFLRDGACVYIPDGACFEQPIEIVYISQNAGVPTMTNPRTLIVVGNGAQATVVERYHGLAALGYFTNAVTEIAVGEGAILDHVKIQDESPTAYHIANTQVVLAAKSSYTTHYVSLGGALVRNEVRVRFDGEHSEATVNGLYLASGKQHIDNFTVIDHAKPKCASHELYKGILDGRAHGVFNGKIFVRKDAQKTDAKQTNKVLLLSDDATINTKPQLEIFADDVKCTHGATVGQLDAAQLFYLQSRGIPLDSARRLLTFAFANDIVGRLHLETLRQELEARIVK
jgi:Fe-S cluster assembly protein SufD